jgi:NADPH-dependent 2,4-dienoyl-CoA reductase/sulfur reductase-like enzyme
LCCSNMATDSAAPAPRGKRVLIVGGVAGGASCAARLRRLDEQAEITIFERGPYVSFANCGLPYFVGDVIKVGQRAPAVVYISKLP